LVDHTAFPNDNHPVASTLSIEAFATRLAAELPIDIHARSRESEFRRQVFQGARDIHAAYQLSIDSLRKGESISPTAEWLVDNYYVIEEQISDVEDLLPIGFLRKLPRTAAGYPRIGELTRQLLAYCSSELDEPTIYRFIEAFQSASPLAIGESWAFPILLRVSLIENLRMVAIQITNAQECQRDAEQRLAIWQARRIFDLGDKTSLHSSPTLVKMLDLLGAPKDLNEVNSGDPGSPSITGDQANGDGVFIDPAVASSAAATSTSSPASASSVTSPSSQSSNRLVDDPQLAILALRQHVRSLGWDLAELARLERHRQAAGQVLIGNIITSMRLVAGLDWMSFFERINHADAVLMKDPLGIYPKMDFLSRNEYRKVIEDIARQSRQSDVAVAETVVEMAKGFVASPEQMALATGKAVAATPEASSYGSVSVVRGHVGYWLVGDGLADLMDKLALHASPTQRLLENMRRHPHAVYFGGLTAITLLVWGTILWFTTTFSLSWPIAILIALLTVLPASDAAMLLHSMIITRLFKPKKLPKLAFREGVPEEFPTIVVVPSMLSSIREARSLVDKLEVHYLNNPDPSLSFALLTDFSDAPQPNMPDDEEKLQEAIAGIRRLNAKYGKNQGPFYLFHRARLWNPSEGAWMGWERKRGKLMEFGKLLRGDSSTSYVVQEGDRQRLAQFHNPTRHPFVVTLDADTQLPRDSAKKMIGTLAHPLNRPHLGRGNIVRTGYSILQPRVTIHLADVTATRYVRVMASSAGLDPYVTAASDVYQDLFGEGSFTGKGIYDLHAFERAVDEAFPENTILSHDLIEGCHARVAVVSDIEVFDGYPLRYDADAKRMHRWVRGDWQISPWLFSKVPYVSGTKPNPLSMLSRWKIFDNLRRSLVGPSTLAMLIVAWFTASSQAYSWSIVAILLAMFPAILAIVGGTIDWIVGYRQLRKPLAVLSHMAKQWWFTIEQCLYSAMLLPHKAVQMVDAIIRSNYRMLVSNKKLLEWETAQAAESRLSKKRWAIYQQLWYLPVLGFVLAIMLPGNSRICALPWIVGWFLAPWITDQISRVKTVKKTTLSYKQRTELRGVLSATWGFLEQFVDQAGNWLPPDNVQEYPSEKVAMRISPTNEGLFLVCALIARDFGLIGMEKMVALLEKNVASWNGLYKYRGHWLNWYDTATCSTLPPRYVSTVDSGNLAVCLMTLRTGLEDYLNRPLYGEFLRVGILDSNAWLLAHVDRIDRQITSTSDPLSGVSQSVRQLIAELSKQLPTNASEPLGWLKQGDKILPLIASLRQVEEQATAIDQRNLARKIRLYCDRVDGVLTDIRKILGWLSQDSIPEFIRTSYNQTMSLSAIVALNQSHQESLTSIPGFNDSVSFIDSLKLRMRALSDWSEESLMQMDFRFLYNPHRKLFSIGFNLETDELDRSHYDLLCSESRLASYFAIAKGDVESNHWFQLGRKATIASGKYSLISWGGTMFEYLMPPLFQKSYDLSLITETCRAAVHHQQEYAKLRGIPWGISESGFSAMAKNSDYHYQSFGVPGLGLKRGLAKDLVISPYSTLMAVPIDPAGAYENLRWLRAEQGEGDWGFYEAIDYTPSRLRRNQKAAVVQSYMAHHQGMAILGLANYLDAGSIQKRFSMHPLAKSSELLLQEKLPSASHVTQVNPDEAEAPPIAVSDEGLVSRRILGVDSKAPRVNVLSNNLPGNHASLLTTQAGGGYTRWQDLQITRWEPDTTLDNAGSFVYLKDIDTGRFWSATFQPTLATPDVYETIFSIDKTEYRREQGPIETHLEITVSPESAAEIRQLRITNHDSVTKHLDVTSYSELLMAKPRHARFDPTFCQRVVETGYDASSYSVYAVRQPFDSHPNAVCVLQIITAPPKVAATVSFETDRLNFLGANRDTTRPIAMQSDRLGSTVGTTKDPILSMRCRVELPPGESVTVTWTTVISQSISESHAIAATYHTQRGVQRAFELSWALVPVELKHQSLTAKDVHLYQRFASAILYPERAYRYAGHSAMDALPAQQPLQLNSTSELASGDVITTFDVSQLSSSHSANQDTNQSVRPMGQADLWPWSISGDWPICLVEIISTEQLPAVKEVLQAHRFLESRGIRHDIVLLNATPGSYYDGLHDQLIGLIRDVQSTMGVSHSSIFLLRASELRERQIEFLRRTATVFMPTNFGSLSNYLAKSQSAMTSSSGIATNFEAPVELHNTLNEDHDKHSDVSVIANAFLSSKISRARSEATWLSDLPNYRITSHGKFGSAESTSERVYVSEILEDGSKAIWLLPHECKELDCQVSFSIDSQDTVKFIDVSITNHSDRVRRLLVTYAVELALDVDRVESQLHIETQIDSESGALIARNSYHNSRPELAVFLQVLAAERSLTGSRKSFLGRNGTWQMPVGLLAEQLDNQVGAGLDPCGAIQSRLTIDPNSKQSVRFLLGVGEDLAHALRLLEKF
jgi:cyclic beta-1,2-glucan synthetase